MLIKYPKNRTPVVQQRRELFSPLWYALYPNVIKFELNGND